MTVRTYPTQCKACGEIYNAVVIVDQDISPTQKTGGQRALPSSHVCKGVIQ